MKAMELKIIGKVWNIEQEKRLAYLEGMLDLIDIISKYDTVDGNFICALHDYLAENGTKSAMIDSFCESYKKSEN